ncbi:hypothetical protein GKA01_20670 [Gluconobacter kanchanaburiensis NBRC 103587]|uniref:Uncharacterized protein n=1 Tax=Gluconobacter kanchanaburiensis NBRC 103587 TaxID=1307948 RepID=A0A511B8U5_9PROT|nr:hypothetical protein AA103587_2583 [Gluconobacter kanchanaburiensis NBRC 103587]GEK96870.1 hypothetical protein GKA01_20670 [Gluconobacter kanchanaburiensis NBRC 103587]
MFLLPKRTQECRNNNFDRYAHDPLDNVQHRFPDCKELKKQAEAKACSAAELQEILALPR